MTHRYVTCTNSKTNIISGFYYVYTAVAEGQKKCKISIPDPRSQKQNSKFAARGGDHPRRAALPGATGESASPTAPPPPRLRQAARPARPLHNSGSSPRPRTTFCVRELIPAAARLHRPCTHSPQGLSARAGNNSPVTQAVSRGQELELPARPGAATPGADERPPGPGGSAPRAGAVGRGGPAPSAPPPSAPPPSAPPPQRARAPSRRASPSRRTPLPRAPLPPARAPSSRRAPPPRRARALPAGPAASPPPRALRSRDVRAAGPGTRQGAGRRVETDPGSV
uniref:Uncharacterized protein n=1 Tax=Rangifer tarandus platyrhynchus TaxID=3082113 RepID=A0ACB0EMV3_RANTA|nr:unnamed protein product [Rangifer tarandus platyrhynchus]